MLVALPSSIAYGVAAYAPLGAAYVGHGVRAGILGAIALGLVASALGGAPRLISSPCAPAGAVVASLVGALVAGSPGAGGPERVIALVTITGLFGGALQLVYGLSGAGRLIKFIPYPVVSGYMSGVGVLIFVSQLPKFFGLPGGGSFFAGLASSALGQWPAIVVGIVTIAGVVLAPRLTRTVPATIIGLAAGLLVHLGLGIFRPELLQLEHNHLVIGPIGSGAGAIFTGWSDQWSTIAGLRAADAWSLLGPALTLSVLLSVDTLKTCVVTDTLTRTRHDSNRTLIGQGAGNLASALAGGMPGAGGMGPTLVNLESGGRTRASGVLEGIFVLTAGLALGRWIAWVPVAALAGILIVVSIRMFDWRSFQLLRQKSTVLDFVVIATVIVVAVGSNLIAAAGAGVALSIVLFIREQIRGSVVRRRITGDRISSTQHRLSEEQAVLEREGALITVCELQGSLFFGTTDQLLTELEPDLKSCRYLILDLRRVQAVDYTAAHMLEQIEATLAERGGFLIFSRLPARRDLRDYFLQSSVMKAGRSMRRYETLDDALQWAEDCILAERLATRSGGERPLALTEFDLLRDLKADQSLAALAGGVVERSFAAGQRVFKAGDPGDELYLVRRGIVRVALPLKGGSHHNLASFGRGNHFGEMAFLNPGARSADATATMDTDLFVISRARFDEVSRTNPVVGAKMFARLARVLALRLRRTDAELRTLYES